MLVDFAQQVEHSEGLTAEESITSLPAALRPIPDDHDGGAARCVPMMLVPELVRSFGQPLGYTHRRRLALSQILTLYTTPVVLHLPRSAADLDCSVVEDAGALRGSGCFAC